MLTQTCANLNRPSATPRPRLPGNRSVAERRHAFGARSATTVMSAIESPKTVGNGLPHARHEAVASVVAPFRAPWFAHLFAEAITDDREHRPFEFVCDIVPSFIASVATARRVELPEKRSGVQQVGRDVLR